MSFDLTIAARNNLPSLAKNNLIRIKDNIIRFKHRNFVKTLIT